MRRKTALTAALILALLLTGLSLAQSGGLNLDWWTVEGGGGSAAGGGYELSGTVGQFDAGALSQSGYELAGGYWTAPGGRAVFLPVVVKTQ